MRWTGLVTLALVILFLIQVAPSMPWFNSEQQLATPASQNIAADPDDQSSDGGLWGLQKKEQKDENLIVLLVVLALINIPIFYLRRKVEARNKARFNKK